MGRRAVRAAAGCAAAVVALLAATVLGPSAGAAPPGTPGAAGTVGAPDHAGGDTTTPDGTAPAPEPPAPEPPAPEPPAPEPPPDPGEPPAPAPDTAPGGGTTTTPPPDDTATPEPAPNDAGPPAAPRPPAADEPAPDEPGAFTLTKIKTAGSNIPGGTITYEIVLEYDGTSCDAGGLDRCTIVEDPNASPGTAGAFGLTAFACPAEFTQPTLGTCVADGLAAGTYRFEATVQVLGEVGDLACNGVRLRIGDGTSPRSSLACTTIAGISMVKSFADDEVARGSTGHTFTVAVTNETDAPITALTMGDSGPPGMTFTGVASDQGGACSIGAPPGASTSCTLASLDPGATWTVTVTYDVDADADLGEACNVAFASGNDAAFFTDDEDCTTVTEPPPDTVTLSVDIDDAGAGTARVDGTGITCAPAADPPVLDCDETFTVTEPPPPASVTASPAERFVGWEGDVPDACQPFPVGVGLTTCAFPMDQDRDVQAVFATSDTELTVDLQGDGAGTVTGDGIDCSNDGPPSPPNPPTPPGPDCQERSSAQPESTLAATPSLFSTFVGWSGDVGPTCATPPGGAPPTTCTVAMTEDREVVATFDATVLRVATAGNGEGAVTDTSTRIDCSDTDPDRNDCATLFVPGSTTTLTATAGVDAVFVGWSGEVPPACDTPPDGPAPSTCPLVMDQDRSITASFASLRDLEVDVRGTGIGTVTDGDQIECSNEDVPKLDCTGRYAEGSEVTLHAAPGPLARFDGWSGSGAAACATPPGGPPPTDCVVAMTDDQEVIAEFTFIGVNLAVVLVGTGTGTVDDSRAQISCSNGPTPDDRCDADYPQGGTTILRAIPTAGFRFEGWSGPDVPSTCQPAAGEEPPPLCVVPLEHSTTVGASFGGLEPRLTVEIRGDAEVRVVDALHPSAIRCSNASPSPDTDCEERYDLFTEVELIVDALDVVRFGGATWSGDAPGCGTGLECPLVMDRDRHVVLTAENRPTNELTVVFAGTGSGTWSRPAATPSTGTSTAPRTARPSAAGARPATTACSRCGCSSIPNRAAGWSPGRATPARARSGSSRCATCSPTATRRSWSSSSSWCSSRPT